MMIICGAQVPADVTAVAGLSGRAGADPLQARVAQVFGGDVAAGRVLSVRAIRTRLHGQPRARWAQAYLAGLTAG